MPQQPWDILRETLRNLNFAMFRRLDIAIWRGQAARISLGSAGRIGGLLPKKSIISKKH
ncbi:hypothetical protein [Ruegeria sp. ANG-R]|uniref:hypothetical protein n=1 Tax=Ruegeria sp. ANG-R TaxID=1577903 RepID=UPI00187BED8C|nr:hypothetical protein [Ruegeria sp. ANG-R]